MANAAISGIHSAGNPPFTRNAALDAIFIGFERVGLEAEAVVREGQKEEMIGTRFGIPVRRILFGI